MSDLPRNRYITSFMLGKPERTPPPLAEVLQAVRRWLLFGPNRIGVDVELLRKVDLGRSGSYTVGRNAEFSVKLARSHRDEHAAIVFDHAGQHDVRFHSRCFIHRAPEALEVVVAVESYHTRKPATDAGLTPGRPRLIGDLVDALCAFDLTQHLLSQPITASTQRLSHIDEFIRHKKRRLPVLLCAGEDEGPFPLDVGNLARRLCGTAHVMLMDSSEESDDLLQKLDAYDTLSGGDMALLLPGFKGAGDSGTCRVWSRDEVERISGSTSGVEKFLVEVLRLHATSSLKFLNDGQDRWRQVEQTLVNGLSADPTKAQPLTLILPPVEKLRRKATEEPDRPTAVVEEGTGAVPTSPNVGSSADEAPQDPFDSRLVPPDVPLPIETMPDSPELSPEPAPTMQLEPPILPTGQTLDAGAWALVLEQTGRYPWLLERVFVALEGRWAESGMPVLSSQQVEQILDDIMSRLDVPGGILPQILEDARVHSVVEPLLAGAAWEIEQTELDYVEQLKLIVQKPHVRFSSPIVEGMVWRHLTDGLRRQVTDRLERFLNTSGGLEFATLLRSFQTFCRHGYEPLKKRIRYRKAAPVLILLAFLRQLFTSERLMPHFAVRSGETRVSIKFQGLTYLILLKRVKASADVRLALEDLEFELQRTGAVDGSLLLYNPRIAQKSMEERYQEHDHTTQDGRQVKIFGI